MKPTRTHKKLIYQFGFTLVELMVSVVLLSIIVASATGPFVSSVRLQRENRVTDDMLDNAQMILNILDKELRTGSGPTTVTNGVRFVNQFNQQVTYTRNVGQGSLRRVVRQNPIGGPIVSDIVYSGSTFRITGFNAREVGTDPRGLTVSLSVTPQNISREQTLQMTIIPRNR